MTKNVWYRSTTGSRIEDRGTVTVEGGMLGRNKELREALEAAAQENPAADPPAG
jgi:hypothetical protein